MRFPLVRLSIAVIIAVTLAAVPGPRGAVAGVIITCHVDADVTASGAGDTWATAYKTLQEALANSLCLDGGVWVAEGVYKPTTYVDDASRTISFNIPPGFQVYGGFDGSEDSLAERNPAEHVTILSGDIDSDDAHSGVGGSNIDETWLDIHNNNSYHVVYMNGTGALPVTNATILDGFTITGGSANGTFGNASGGGLYCDGHGAGKVCSPMLTNLSFRGNQAANPGGGTGYGGALFNNGLYGNSSPTISNVTFSGNYAFSYGGAIYNNGQGGISSPTLLNVTFSANRSMMGGAMVNLGTAIAPWNGVSSPSLSYVTFSGNAGTNQWLTGKGGALWNKGGADGTYTGTAHPVLSNVILWGDTADTASGGPEIYNEIGGAADISYSILQQVCGSGVNCLGEITYGDPKLGPLADNGGPTQTMALLTGSEALDVASHSCPATDQRGISRPQGPRCDIGAFEVAQPTFSAKPDTWNYGLVRIGTTSTGKVFTVKNMGTAPLVVGSGSITLAGANPGQFKIMANGCAGHTLAELATCTVTVAFKPTSAGPKLAEIRIDDNSWGHPHSIPLSGRGADEQALNGGFNTYPSATAKIPTNWTAANFASTDGKNTTYKKEGAASIKIANTSVRTKTLTQTRTLSGPAGSLLTLSLWAKGQNIPTTAGAARAQVLLYNGATLKKTATLNLPTGSYGFTQYKLAFTSPSAYTRIVIRLTYSKGTGAIWFDGLSLLKSPWIMALAGDPALP